jgi:DNA phosphorothioation-associated putative methyltransferase
MPYSAAMPISSVKVVPNIVGKVVHSHTYVHKSNVSKLPQGKRILLAKALMLVGEYEYDLVKFSNDETGLSILRYPNFDRDPHPTIAYSVKVILPSKHVCFTNYANSANPPILHRKETLVSPEYRHYAKFKALTEAEEAAGLLSRRDIGNKNQWAALLKTKNLTIKGHSLTEIQ